jgi:hypothetical protein
MGYVMDPVTKTPITLHILWDSNVLRVPTVAVVDRHTQEFMKKYPRSAFPELKAHPISDPNFFREWAQESHQVAVDWAFDVEMATDPDKNQTSEQLARIIHESLYYDRHLHVISGRTRASRLDIPGRYACVAHCCVRPDLMHI